MKKLSRDEMRKIAGGTNKYQWSCYSSSYGGYVTICSATDPSSHCTICGSDCTNTGVSCGNATICIC
jgi:hypothetical protein